jgi:hypothetical protein
MGRSSPDRIQLQAARTIVPYRQGELDGLCGLYAVVNAIRVALHEASQLSHAQAQRMWMSGLLRLQERGWLPLRMMDGIEWPDLLHIAEALLEIALPVGAKPIVRQLPESIDHAKRWRWIATELERSRPILVHQDQHYHYTVITGLTPTRITLFDSSGSTWAQRIEANIGHAASIGFSPN